MTSLTNLALDASAAALRTRPARAAVSHVGARRAWIAELVGRGTGATFTEPERLARALVLRVVAGQQAEAQRSLAELAAVVGNAIAVSVLFQITRFISVCTLGRLLDVSLPVPSIFEGEPGASSPSPY